MQLERGTFFFLWGTSVVTHFFFHKVQRIPFLPDKGTVHQLWLIRGWLEATGASIHKGPGSPVAPGKTGLGPSAAPCGFLNTLHFSSVQSLSCVRLFATPWTAAPQAFLSITIPGAYSNSCPSSQWCHPTISSSVVPFSSHLQSLPDQGLFRWVSSSHQVAKVLEFQLQHRSFQWIFRTDFL